jgi:hypothetical protein
MRKVIPAVEQIICDRCQHVINANIQCLAKVKVQISERSAVNNDMGGHSFDLDLCSRCTTDFQSFLKDKK